ncbi:MAG: MFS transporter [Planctomycetes bacterium]|jgi:FSR family fosmidomycin resistance protein-like MFS transporter|nr:MFS transporter [Planctomycetota bacterium]MDA8375511.1 MFS transporter [Planctomycetia bacterium]
MMTATDTDVPVHYPPGKTSETRQQLAGLMCMTWAHFLNDGAAFYLPGILPAILTALHEPLAMVGIIMAAIYLGQALQPLAGIVADKIGGKLFVIGGLAACSVAGAFVGLAPNIGILLILLLLTGLGSTIFHPQALAAVRSLTQRRHGAGLALFLIGGELGRGVWPLLTSLIVVYLGLHQLWIIALPTLMTLPLMIKLIPSLPPRRQSAPRIHWREHRRPFLVLVRFSAFRGLAVFGTIVFIPLMWKLRGGTLVSGASIISTLLITGVIGQATGGTLADHLGRRPVLVGSSAVMLMLLPLVAIVRGPWLWLVAALLGIAMFSTFSPTLLIGQDLFPENRALGSGIALGLSNALGAVGLLPLGWVLHVFGIYVIFGILTVSAALMLITSLTFTRHVHPCMQ